jgi:hypothetical protein
MYALHWSIVCIYGQPYILCCYFAFEDVSIDVVIGGLACGVGKEVGWRCIWAG